MLLLRIELIVEPYIPNLGALSFYYSERLTLSDAKTPAAFRMNYELVRKVKLRSSCNQGCVETFVKMWRCQTICASGKAHGYRLALYLLLSNDTNY